MPQAKRAAPTSRPIGKRDAGAWWCPFCGHSNMHGLQSCGGCGAERDGDSVKLPRAAAEALEADDAAGASSAVETRGG